MPQPLSIVLATITISAAADPSKDGSLLGIFDPSTLFTVVLIPLFLVVFGVWLTIRWHDRFRARILRSLKEKRFRELATLYCDRVPDCERVPPNHFRAFFTREYSAKSVRDFARRARADDGPVHLLIVARDSKGIGGFLKAIYVPASRCLFVAYFVVTRESSHEEHTASQALLSVLFRAAIRSRVESVVFELCVHPDSNHEAKARLFRHYAAAYDLKVRRIMAQYKQPEICSFEAGDCAVTDAELYIAYVADRALDAWHTITRDDYLSLVSSLYRNVYLLSYALAAPTLVERYRVFIDKVLKSVASANKSKAITLQ